MIIYQDIVNLGFIQAKLTNLAYIKITLNVLAY